MTGTYPSIDFSPFVSGFRYNPDSPTVQGIEGRNTFHALPSPLQPELMSALQEELHIPTDRDIIVFERWCPLKEWDGYFFDLVGTYEIPGDPKDAPRFWFHSPPADRGQEYTARDEH